MEKNKNDDTSPVLILRAVFIMLGKGLNALGRGLLILLRLIYSLCNTAVSDFQRTKAQQQEEIEAVSPENKRKTMRSIHAAGYFSMLLFLTFLFLMAVLSFVIPLRPTYSDLEQRTLTAFPKASVVRILDGDYFDDLNTWFADTFPFRERFLALHTSIEGLYGFKNTTIVGTAAQGDDIPTAPKDPASVSPAPSESAASSEPEQEPVAAVSSAQPEPEPEAAVSFAQPESESEAAVFSAQPEPESEAAVSSTQPEPEASVSSTQPEPEASAEKTDQDFSDAKVETINAVLVVGDSAYEYYNFVQDTADTYLSAINNAGKELNGIANCYAMVVPTSMDVTLPDQIRSSVSNASDQVKAIDYLYSSMPDNMTTIPVMDALRAHRDEYIYFRTDHHWTALGAYYAYREFANTVQKPVADPDQDYKRVSYDGFTGSLYRESESAALAAHPDTVDAYIPNATNDVDAIIKSGENYSYRVVNDVTDISATQKYMTFIGGDNPLAVIENPTLNDDSTIILVKESFGNCFAPWLVYNYQHVYVVDYRYFNDVDSRHLKQLAQDVHADDVLFLNNIGATRTDSLMNDLRSFVG